MKIGNLIDALNAAGYLRSTLSEVIHDNPLETSCSVSRVNVEKTIDVLGKLIEFVEDCKI